MLAVFRDAEIDWVTRWLKPGFRHCLVAVETEGGWVVCDPLAHWLEVSWLAPCGYDLAAFYRAQGCSVVAVDVQAPKAKGCPIFLFTCVEVAKRALGIRAWWCWTPWQLWRRLNARDAASRADPGA